MKAGDWAYAFWIAVAAVGAWIAIVISYALFMAMLRAFEQAGWLG